VEEATATAQRKKTQNMGGDRNSDDAKAKRQARRSADQEEEGGTMFTAETASVTGKSQRQVQHVVERGEKIAPDVMERVRGTRLDTGDGAYPGGRQSPAGGLVVSARGAAAIGQVRLPRHFPIIVARSRPSAKRPGNGHSSDCDSLMRC